MLRSLLRLVVYFILLAAALALIGSYEESFERVLVQTAFFTLVSLYLVYLIRLQLPLLRHALPELLYLLATLYFTVASAIRLFDFLRPS